MKYNFVVKRKNGIPRSSIGKNLLRRIKCLPGQIISFKPFLFEMRHAFYFTGCREGHLTAYMRIAYITHVVINRSTIERVRVIAQLESSTVVISILSDSSN